jgi:hypothetical protein
MLTRGIPPGAERAMALFLVVLHMLTITQLVYFIRSLMTYQPMFTTGLSERNFDWGDNGLRPPFRDHGS